MGLVIEDGKGSGRSAEVNSENRLKTVAENHSLQYHVSSNNAQAYQVQGIDTGITAKTQTILHVKNDSNTKDMVLTYIRMQPVCTGTVPAVGIYFEVGVGETIASGGTVITPVNMNQSSGNTADVVATGIDPTMGGIFTVVDTQYVESNGKEIAYNKEGTIVLGKGDTCSVRLTTTGTGEAKARISFLMIDKEE
jgi:hypothetical protein